MLALPSPRGDQIRAIRWAINDNFALLSAANRANHLRLGRAVTLRFPQFTKWTSQVISFRREISQSPVGEGALALPYFGHVSGIAPGTNRETKGESAENDMVGEARSLQKSDRIADPGAERREG